MRTSKFQTDVGAVDIPLQTILYISHYASSWKKKELNSGFKAKPLNSEVLKYFDSASMFSSCNMHKKGTYFSDLFFFWNI